MIWGLQQQFNRIIWLISFREVTPLPLVFHK